MFKINVSLKWHRKHNANILLSQKVQVPQKIFFDSGTPTRIIIQVSKRRQKMTVSEA
jgi:hypothetical protein